MENKQKTLNLQELGKASEVTLGYHRRYCNENGRPEDGPRHLNN